jgi:hypothetical protein
MSKEAGGWRGDGVDNVNPKGYAFANDWHNLTLLTSKPHLTICKQSPTILYV